MNVPSYTRRKRKLNDVLFNLGLCASAASRKIVIKERAKQAWDFRSMSILHHRYVCSKAICVKQPLIIHETFQHVVQSKNTPYYIHLYWLVSFMEYNTRTAYTSFDGYLLLLHFFAAKRTRSWYLSSWWGDTFSLQIPFKDNHGSPWWDLLGGASKHELVDDMCAVPLRRGTTRGIDNNTHRHPGVTTLPTKKGHLSCDNVSKHLIGHAKRSFSHTQGTVGISVSSNYVHSLDSENMMLWRCWR